MEKQTLLCWSKFRFSIVKLRSIQNMYVDSILKFISTGQGLFFYNFEHYLKLSASLPVSLRPLVEGIVFKNLCPTPSHAQPTWPTHVHTHLISQSLSYMNYICVSILVYQLNFEIISFYSTNNLNLNSKLEFINKRWHDHLLRNVGKSGVQTSYREFETTKCCISI